MSNLLLRNTQEVKDDNNALSIEIIVVDLSENGHTRFLVIQIECGEKRRTKESKRYNLFGGAENERKKKYKGQNYIGEMKIGVIMSLKKEKRNKLMQNS